MKLWVISLELTNKLQFNNNIRSSTEQGYVSLNVGKLYDVNYISFSYKIKLSYLFHCDNIDVYDFRYIIQYNWNVMDISSIYSVATYFQCNWPLQQISTYWTCWKVRWKAVRNYFCKNLIFIDVICVTKASFLLIQRHKIIFLKEMHSENFFSEINRFLS